MDISKAITFVFEDDDWLVKVLLGALITLIPIFGQLALLGYMIAIIRNVKAGDPNPLPRWDALGTFFMDGLMVWLASLVYALPLILFMCVIGFIWIPPIVAGEDAAPVLAGLSGVVTAGVSCLIGLYGLLLALVTPVIQIRYAEAGEIGACLRFGKVFGMAFSQIGPVIISQLLVWVAGGIVGSILGSVTFGLLALPVAFWTQALAAHLYGQIARRA